MLHVRPRPRTTNQSNLATPGDRVNFLMMVRQAVQEAIRRLVKKIFLDQQTVVVVAVVVLVETEAALVATSNLTAWTSFQLCKVDCKSELHQLKLGHCQVAQISNDNVPSVSLRTCVAFGY